MTTPVRVPVRNRSVFSAVLVVLAVVVGVIFAFTGIGGDDSAAVAPRAALVGFLLVLAAASTVLSVRTIAGGVITAVIALAAFALYLVSVLSTGTPELVFAAFSVVLAIVVFGIAFATIGSEESLPAEPETAGESARRVDMNSVSFALVLRVIVAVLVLVVAVIFAIGAMQSPIVAASNGLGLTLIVAFLAIAALLLAVRSKESAGLMLLAVVAALTAFGGAVWPSETWFAVVALITAILAGLAILTQIVWARKHG